MSGKLKLSFSAAALLALPGFSTPAAAQPAVLYEIVENIDVQKTFATGHRVSNWTAQGAAKAGTPFCPTEHDCTITAFGTDDIGPSGTGWVWANIAATAQFDNATDGPEFPFFTGQIVGDVSVVSPKGTFVAADLNKNKTVLGPMFPLIYVQSGQFFADANPTVRTQPSEFDSNGKPVPGGSLTATFTSTFRLPFNVGKTGARERPERGRNAYYLGDDGSLIKVDKQDEFSQGFPLLRAEVVF